TVAVPGRRAVPPISRATCGCVSGTSPRADTTETTTAETATLHVHAARLGLERDREIAVARWLRGSHEAHNMSQPPPAERGALAGPAGFVPTSSSSRSK